MGGYICSTNCSVRAQLVGIPAVLTAPWEHIFQNKDVKTQHIEKIKMCLI